MSAYLCTHWSQHVTCIIFLCCKQPWEVGIIQGRVNSGLCNQTDLVLNSESANLLVVWLEESYLCLTNLGDVVCKTGIIAIPTILCVFYVHATLCLYLLKAWSLCGVNPLYFVQSTKIAFIHFCPLVLFFNASQAPCCLCLVSLTGGGGRGRIWLALPFPPGLVSKGPGWPCFQILAHNGPL